MGSPCAVRDVNGDGRDDLILPLDNPYGTGEGLVIRTKLSNADGSWSSTDQVMLDGAGLLNSALLGDVNGDGLADLVLPYDNVNLRVRTILRSASGT